MSRRARSRQPRPGRPSATMRTTSRSQASRTSSRPHTRSCASAIPRRSRRCSATNDDAVDGCWSRMTEKTNVQAVRDTLLAEFRRDERYILLGEDVGVRGGVFRVSDGFIEEFGRDRIIDTPVAESSIVGVAIGAAIGGLRPVAEMQFADFHAPAFEQIVNEAARMRYRSVGAFGVPLVIRMPWGGGVRGALYHSQSVEAFYAHVPGLKVVAPSTPY